MKNERTQAWADALRSGEYQQVKGALARTDPWNNKIVGYCCLGVVCELAGIRPEHTAFSTIQFANQTAVLPKEGTDWLGIDTEHGGNILIDMDHDYITREGGSRLVIATTLNDEADFTFQQIGDLVAYFGVSVYV